MSESTTGRTRPNLIARVDAMVGGRSGLRGQVAGYVVVGVSQGLAFALVVPVLRAFFDGDIGEAARWLIFAAISALVAAVTLWFVTERGYFAGIEKISGALMQRLGEHAARLPLGWFTKESAGRLTSAVSTATQNVMNVPSVFLQQLVVAVTTPLTVIIVTAFIDWRVALAFVVTIPVALIMYRSVGRDTGAAHAAVGASTAEVANRVIEFGQAQPVLRAAGLTESTWGRLEDALAANHRDVRQALEREGGPMARFTFTIEAGFAVVVVLVVYLALGGGLGVADAIAVLVLAIRFVEPLTFVGAYGSGIEIAQRSLDQISEILDVKPLPEPTEPVPPADASIELSEVGFGYGDTPVLARFSLHCEPGTVTALVGPSGSGKTTVTRLIARFWDVGTGSVRVGGVDVRDIGSTELMRNLAMVFQDVYLFDATIEENVRLGRPEATDAEVRAAAAAARLTEVIERLPLGWATPVGEAGSRLSGGERQRVSIARALLKDAPIVLLDEATAALDGESEAAVVAAMAELAHGRTVVVIAHRMSTVMGADQIAVLDEGKISELGTHGELVDAGGLYSAFWAERTKAAGWSLREADA